MPVICSKNLKVPSLMKKKASDFAVGESVFLIENGSPVEYLVVHQGLPSSLYDSSCNGMWLLRKDIWEKQKYHYSQNGYITSDIHGWLLGESSSILTTFSKEVQDSLLVPKIPYAQYNSNGTVNSGTNGFGLRIFLLSGYEVGWTTTTSQYFPVDGACLNHFKGTSTTDPKRIANFNGTPTHWWLRSFPTNNNSNAFAVYSTGGNTTLSVNSEQGIRPAVIINHEVLFDSSNVIIGLENPHIHDTFSVNGVYYKVDSDMMWMDWASSEYNVDYLRADDNGSNVISCSGAMVTDEDGQYVFGEDIIKVGGTYYFEVR